MKTLLFTTVCTLLTTFAIAQTGSWYAGGNIGLNTTKTKIETNGSKSDGTTINSWSFSPEMGTFFSDHVQVGLGITIQGTKEEDVSKSAEFGGTLYGRYFFGAGNFRPFAALNIQALPGNAEQLKANIEFSTFRFGINANAGFGYALSDKVTAVGSFGLLGFSSYTQKNKNTDVKTITNNFGLDAGTLGNRFTIGIYFTL